jgi:hypothetical protein
MIRLDDVIDRRSGEPVTGSWEAWPLKGFDLSGCEIGRTVIYVPARGQREAGTVTSYREFPDGRAVVFARYSSGDTSAGADWRDLYLAIRKLDQADK